MIAQVEVLPGAHVIARTGSAIIVVAHPGGAPVTADSPAMHTLALLRGLVYEAAEEEPGAPWQTFARLVGGRLSEIDNPSEFGVALATESGLGVHLSGALTLVADNGAGVVERIGGQGDGSAVNRVLAVPRVAAGIFVDEPGTEPAVPAIRGVGDLVDGVAVGGGAVIRFVFEPGGAATLSAGEAEELPPPAVSARIDGAADSTLAERAPLPIRAAGAGTASTPGRSRVRGYYCARHHLNDPRVSFCSVCGIRMDQRTGILQEGVRPPLGLLVVDDGFTIVLDTDCVIGRDPERSDAARQGMRSIRLSDNSGGMSRAHVEIRLHEWDVLVIDRESTNGTFVRAPGTFDWFRLLPGQPAILAPGSEVAVGRRLIIFDSPHGRLPVGRPPLGG